MNNAFRAILLFLLCALTYTAWPASAADAGNWYVRGALSGFGSRSADFSDVNCAQTNPPAFFGCQKGNDGKPIGARGDFDSGVSIEAGIGYRFLSWLRGEVLLDYMPSVDYSGAANFLKVPGRQPVHGSGESLAAFAAVWFDLPAMGRWRPYLGLGAGLARNHMGPMTYEFPGLGPGDYTRVGGASRTDFAWFAGAGVTVTLTRMLRLDLGLRYSDLGEMRTASGPITIVRGGQTFVIDAGATRTDFRIASLRVSLRYRF